MTAEPPTWVPDTCTLPTAEQPLRVAEFDAFFATHARTVSRPDPHRLVVTFDAVAAATAVDLVSRESGCCSFFTFGFRDGDAATTVMDISVPRDRTDVLDALCRRIGGVLS